MAAIAVSLLLWGILALLSIWGGYLLLLTVAAFTGARQPSGRVVLGRTRFAVLVPAHNEQSMVAETLSSLLGQDYPTECFAVHLIADNCSDETAAIGRQHGVIVHERFDGTRLGKGQALAWALQEPEVWGAADAFVFVDADTLVDRNFLAVIDRHLQDGADAVQVSYRVRDPDSHFLVSLRALAFALIHDLRGKGKSRLGFSAGIWGNGIALTRRCIEAVPWSSFSAVEDAEQHLRLVQAGYRVKFAAGTHVYGFMPADRGALRVQQSRWEAGRLTMIRRYLPGLLGVALSRRSGVALVALIELTLPPLSAHVMFCGVGIVLAAASGGVGALIVATASMGAIVAYVVAGFVMAALPRKCYANLRYAPTYIIWKAYLYFTEVVRAKEPQWLRTARDR